MKKIAFIAMAALLTASLWGQSEEPAPTKYNSTWHTLVFVDFKPGKVDEAKKIIAKFESAGEKAGTPKPETFWFETGKYDMMLIWDLQNGPSDLEWRWSPDGVTWYNALVEQEGSSEAADKLQAAYSALVSGSDSYLIRQDK